jgi:hypothetical protein
MAKPVFEFSLSLDGYVDHDRIPPRSPPWLYPRLTRSLFGFLSTEPNARRETY